MFTFSLPLLRPSLSACIFRLPVLIVTILSVQTFDFLKEISGIYVFLTSEAMNDS